MIVAKRNPTIDNAYDYLFIDDEQKYTELKTDGWKDFIQTDRPMDGLLYNEKIVETDSKVTQIWVRATHDTLEEAMTDKIAEMSATCGVVIVNGVDVTLKDGTTHHYSMTIEDQTNLLSLYALFAQGQSYVPYHADGEECVFYSLEDFSLISQACINWKLYHESYFNSLRTYIRSMTTVEEVEAVQYGLEVPEQYQSDVFKHLLGGDDNEG